MMGMSTTASWGQSKTWTLALLTNEEVMAVNQDQTKQSLDATARHLTVVC